LDILTFVNTAELKCGSLKVWNWIVHSYKIKPKSCHVINPPRVNPSMEYQRWSKSSQR